MKSSILPMIFAEATANWLGVRTGPAGRSETGRCSWEQKKKAGSTFGVRDGVNGKVWPDQAAVANLDPVDGRVEDAAVPVDEGGAADLQLGAVVDEDGRFEVGR
jgi:hypothetical protein